MEGYFDTPERLGLWASPSSCWPMEHPPMIPQAEHLPAWYFNLSFRALLPTTNYVVNLLEQLHDTHFYAWLTIK
jgi:hypothetical protein